MKKKGVVESQFNWIFILFVGAIILIFFLTFSSNQKKNAEVQISAELLNHLDSVAKGAALSIGTVYNISLPYNKDLQKDCEIGKRSALKFSNEALSGVDISYTPLFSTKNIKGDILFTYSQYWNAPYVVTPLLYMVGDKTFFLVVKNDASYDKIIQEFYDMIPVSQVNTPDGTNYLKALIGVGDLNLIPQSNWDFYTNFKIIYFGNYDLNRPDLSIFNTKKTKVQIYDVQGSDYDSSFSVNVYNVTSSGIPIGPETTYGFGMPTLLALVFSEDVADYTCGMKKAFLKYEIVSVINHDKANWTQEFVINNTLQNTGRFHTSCHNYYAIEKFKDLIVLSSELFNSSDLTKLDDLDNPTGNLNDNNDFLGDLSCPLPY